LQPDIGTHITSSSLPIRCRVVRPAHCIAAHRIASHRTAPRRAATYSALLHCPFHIAAHHCDGLKSERVRERQRSRKRKRGLLHICCPSPSLVTDLRGIRALSLACRSGESARVRPKTNSSYPTSTLVRSSSQASELFPATCKFDTGVLTLRYTQ
jgi:hypothetical protein